MGKREVDAPNFALVLLLFCCGLVIATKDRPLKNITDDQSLHYLTENQAYMEEFKELLRPILMERVSGSDANVVVRKYIKDHMQDCGWIVEEDSFADGTPKGNVNFVNLIATLNPGGAERVIVACHYDSKDMPNFIGATDSAVPCAIMMETAKRLSCLLTKAQGRTKDDAVPDLTLQFVFFDGEEAFRHWTSKDSIYGARHLADLWKDSDSLSSIRELILLDLIGTSDTKFKKQFDSTESLYENLMEMETTLREKHLLSYGHNNTIFTSSRIQEGAIGDDHIPFWKDGVDILHLISVPFPSVWHKNAKGLSDDESHLDYHLIDNFSRIFRVFVAGLLHLEPKEIGCR